MNKFLSLLGFDSAKHSVRVEMIAGLTTFLTMSYILAVNPLILGEAGMDKGAVFSATVVAAAVATLVMAFYAKLPFALASGMGLNAFFAYTLVLVMGYSWQEALAAVCVEGVVFILLTIFKAREAIVNAIPLNLRYSISVGIGLLVLVGVMMMRPITQIDFDDVTEVVPGFITIVMMPFTASISEGIFLGMLSYVLVKVLSGRYREVSLFMYILALFFLLKYVAPLLH